MVHVACEARRHEYRCGAATGQCHRSGICTQCRFIPVDSGLFQQIPHATEQIKQAYDIRKNCERPFNLLKNQTGLETVRVRSQHATMARCTLSSIAVLLIKMAGTRRKKTAVIPQQTYLFADAAWQYKPLNYWLSWNTDFVKWLLLFEFISFAWKFDT